MQFDYDSFNIPIKMATMLCKFDEWKRLSDICVIDEDRLAVCDHKARKIYVLYAKSTNSTGNLRSEDSDRSKHTISASVTPLANDAIAGSCESSSLHNTGDKLYSADASDDESTSLSSGLFDMSDCHTIGAPKSIAFVHNRFYTVEGGCIRKYSWQDSRCLGKLALVDEDGEPMEHIRPFSLHSCATNDWLLIVDKENCCVVCVNIFGTAERIFGPRISAKYSLEDPVQAVSRGTHLFICCPEQAIFFVRISDGRTVTQTKEHLRLSRPIRLAWSEVTSRLIVMDNKDNGSYTVDVFDVTGGGIGGLSKANISYLKLDSYNEPDLVCFPESDKVVYTSNDSKVTLFGSEIFYNPPGDSDSTCRFVQSQLLSGICVVCEGLVAVCDKKTRWIRVLSMK
uniref:CNH domain-containing protein n=1 Tax=Macrostomum lignano TaxID=282301 RepID=A0A1I8GPZ1_9PLAT